eukprot:12604931-Alexandrium_andersonii.AAC.1
MGATGPGRTMALGTMATATVVVASSLVETSNLAGLSSSGYFRRLDFKLSSALGLVLDEHKDLASDIN